MKLPVVTLLATTGILAPSAAEEGKSTLTFLQEHCVACHGEKKQKGKFALHDIDPNPAGKDVERWEKILEMVSLEEMPPDDEPQPTSEARAKVTDWLTTELRKIGRGPDPGRDAFPKHRVVPVTGRTIAKGGGGVHCITQQVPAV